METFFYEMSGLSKGVNKIAMFSQIVGICVVITFFSFLPLEQPLSLTKEDATAQWNAVKGTQKESAFIIDFILKINMPGSFPHILKERFYDIATPEDAKYLLDKLVNPRFREKTTAITLLKGLNGVVFTVLFKEYLYITSSDRVQRKLYNLILYQDSLVAFHITVTYLNYLLENGKEDRVFFHLSGMSVFKNPDIRQTIIAGVSSTSVVTRAASYVASRNYPDEEVLEIIDHALATDTARLLGEENSPYYLGRRAGTAGQQDTLIVHFLKIAKKEITRTKKKLHSKNSAEGMRKKGNTAPPSPLSH